MHDVGPKKAHTVGSAAASALPAASLRVSLRPAYTASIRVRSVSLVGGSSGDVVVAHNLHHATRRTLQPHAEVAAHRRRHANRVRRVCSRHFRRGHRRQARGAGVRVVESVANQQWDGDAAVHVLQRLLRGATFRVGDARRQSGDRLAYTQMLLHRERVWAEVWG